MSKYKAETPISLLLAITLFAVTILAFSRWQSKQNNQLSYHFQKQQAIQILDNQIALKLAELDCEHSVTQNQIRYNIQCAGNKQNISFPLGKIELNND